MENLIKEGEQMMEGGNNNSSNQGQSNNNQSSNQDNNQQQSSNNTGGGFMAGMKQNTEDAFVNNEINSFMTKEGLPPAMDGVVDGVVDTEFNKYA